MDKPRPEGAPVELHGDDREETVNAIKGEIVAASLGRNDPGRGWGFIRGNQDRARELQAAFWSARTIRARLAVGRYWTVDNSMSRLGDPAAENMREGESAATAVLLQLIILSRMTGDDSSDLSWHERVRAEIGALQQELGVESTWATSFPGITTGVLIEAICDGRVRMGSPDQPDPHGETTSSG